MIVMTAASEEGCSFGDVGCVIGETIGTAANSAFTDFVSDIWKLLIDFLGWINTFWVGIPGPDVTSPAIGQINGWIGWYTAAIALIGLLLGLGRMAIQNDFKAGLPAVKMLVNLILVTGVYAVAFAGLMTAADKFAPWIIAKATGEDLSLSSMLSLTEMMLIYPGGGLFLAIIGLIGAIVNVVFMLVQGALASVMFAVLPAVAAGSGTETGASAFRQLQGWLLAVILFKPVAAIIYAFGMMQMKNPPPIEIDDIGKAIYTASVAMMILGMAALALPALIKFLVPVAASATSNAFSGGAAVAGVAAAGSAVVMIGAVAATGGAAAPAAGSAAAAGGGAVAGGAASGAASSGAATGGVAGGAGSTGSAGGAAGAGATSSAEGVSGGAAAPSEGGASSSGSAAAGGSGGWNAAGSAMSGVGDSASGSSNGIDEQGSDDE